MFACLCEYIRAMWKKMPTELTWVVVGCPIWVLWTERRSSVRAISTLNCWAISSFKDPSPLLASAGTGTHAGKTSKYKHLKRQELEAYLGTESLLWKHKDQSSYY